MLVIYTCYRSCRRWRSWRVWCQACCHSFLATTVCQPVALAAGGDCGVLATLSLSRCWEVMACQVSAEQGLSYHFLPELDVKSWASHPSYMGCACAVACRVPDTYIWVRHPLSLTNLWPSSFSWPCAAGRRARHPTVGLGGCRLSIRSHWHI